MPKNPEIKSVLVIGSGPITIGQACEFDYSGVQALRALREEGVRIILANSNPATVMTDPQLADRTYIEPLSVSFLSKIIEREKPDALLPTMGGQTALNLSLQLADRGILERYGVQLIGASVKAIRLGEDRELFRNLMTESGLDTCRGGFAHSMQEARVIAEEVGFPIIIRPSFTLGGTGGGIAEDMTMFEEIAARGLAASPNSQILVEESIIGWKEFEFEVIRDQADNAIIVCSIENIDAMGIHTGDSMTVAPAQTLNDEEYQRLRDISLRVLRLVGVDTGGSNVQFAVDPLSDRTVVVEMNPRVSRSSALASKATGYPIAKVATKLALGYRLDELENEITKVTPASFEPALDYVVVKIPRWAFEKFPAADATLTTQMKSVGEVMSMGRGFKQALQKAVQSLEVGWESITSDIEVSLEGLEKGLRVPNWQRLRYIAIAFRQGMSLERVAELTRIDGWFLAHIHELVGLAKALAEQPEDFELLRNAKEWGFSDRELARICKTSERDIRRLAEPIPYAFHAVDTCAGEFPAVTPYLYGTYGESSDIKPLEGPKVVIFGSGPNRIGQGIEFDYCCVQAVWGFQKSGFKAIMVNCNPETVSTDFDLADRLYFEPLTLECVLKILEFEQPDGVIVGFGGQTALNLAGPLHELGYPIIGTSYDAIELAEDRERFSELLNRLGIRQAEHGIAFGREQAKKTADRIGYPVMVRPSFVLGGRAMAVVFDETELDQAISDALKAAPNQPILVDRFLDDALEFDVDAVCDGKEVMIAGVMQHIEEAGIHSGDSSCVLPPVLINERVIEELERQAEVLAFELGVSGLINIQFAIHQDDIYVIEANPRCSRTVPFAAKAIGFPVAEIAARVMSGSTLAELDVPLRPKPLMWHVKSPVFPFTKLLGEDPITGPEMKSTGEVMGSSHSLGNAFAKAYRATGAKLPRNGIAFVSVAERDKSSLVDVARGLYQLGFELMATRGTAAHLRDRGLNVIDVAKVHEGTPNIVDQIRSGDVKLIINTPVGRESHHDDRYIRFEAMKAEVPCVTTISAACAVVAAIRAVKSERLDVYALQDNTRLRTVRE